MLLNKMNLVTKDTAGKLIYQEQFIEILLKVGFSFEEANLARRNIAKRKMDKVDEFRNKLISMMGEEEAEGVDLLISSTYHLYSRTFAKDFEKGATAFIDALLNSEGRLQYTYQFYMVYNMLVGIEETSTLKVADFEEAKEMMIAKIQGKYKLILPELTNKVVDLFEKSDVGLGIKLQYIPFANQKTN